MTDNGYSFGFSGFGQQLDLMLGWLDQNCGTDGWTTAPAGLRGVVNDAIAIYFLDPALANAFVVHGVSF